MKCRSRRCWSAPLCLCRPRARKKHLEVLATNDRGETVELHIDRDGLIRKEKRRSDAPLEPFPGALVLPSPLETIMKRLCLSSIGFVLLATVAAAQPAPPPAPGPRSRSRRAPAAGRPGRA